MIAGISVSVVVFLVSNDFLAFFLGSLASSVSSVCRFLKYVEYSIHYNIVDSNLLSNSEYEIIASSPSGDTRLVSQPSYQTDGLTEKVICRTRYFAPKK